MPELQKRPAGKKILMFLPRVPYPLQANGISIRYLPIIKHLSKTHTLDLAIFQPDVSKKGNQGELGRYCRHVSYIQNPKYSDHGIFSRIGTYFRFALPGSPPLSVLGHGAGEIRRVIEEQAGKDRYDALIWVGAAWLPHLLDAMPLKSVGKVLVDFIDSPSLVRKRWADDIFRLDLLNRYEMRKTIRWEGSVIRKADDTVYISDVDAHTVPERFAPGRRRHVVPNGIVCETYDPSRLDGIVSPSIGFLGNMAYPPNIEAATWLFKEVFLPLKEKMTDLSLVLIGREPVASIREMAKSPGVTVTGAVESIWPHINSVDLFLFPLWTGAGLKNKILETMLAGRPVLTTTIGNEGIDAEDGRELLICGNAGEFQEKTLALFDSREKRRSLGEHAREFVTRRFAWPPILESFEGIVDGQVSTKGSG